jgi:ankyrin repeat protein
MTRLLPILVLLPALASAADDPLVRAAAAGDGAAIRALLKQGHDVNATGPDGATALHWAVRADDLATVDALIRAGAKVGAANALGVQPIYVAAQNGNAAVLQRLLDAKADVNTTDAAGDTLLMAAVRAESIEAVRLLLARGANVNAADPDVRQTALMWATRVNSAEIMRALLTAGATVDTATRASAKPAARPPGAGGGSHGVGIVRGGVPPQGEQPPANGGLTPLLFAARDGLLDAAKLLVEAGANLNTPEPNGITPLLMAITNGQLPVAQWLVERGADVRAADWYGRTPIWATVEIRNLDLRSNATNPADNGVDREAALKLLAALIDKGADVNARVKEFPPARRYMLPLGSLEWVDITGQTAFTRAAQSADIEAMKLLLSKGADPKITTFNGTNALMMAAGVNWVISQTYGSRWLEATQLCLDLGFDVNAVNQMGLAAVHGAANRGSDDVIELLAKHGARLDVKDKEGRTPTTWAEGVFLATNSPIAKPSTIALIARLTKP